jgi:hypothetical protein
MQDADVCLDLSGIPETRETATPADRDSRRLDQLYRDCPTAFWLEPGGDIGIPVDLTHPAAATPPETTPAADHFRGGGGAVMRAALCAGPIFTALALVSNPGMPHGSWSDPIVRVLASAFLLAFTTPIGFILGFLPIVAGTICLGTAAVRYPRLRSATAWAGTGGVMGTVLAALFGAGSEGAVATIGTSIACALIAHHAVRWDAAEPA